jgi:hypothetical protein
MIAHMVRPLTYLGLLIVLWASTKQRERRAAEPQPAPAPLESVLSSTRVLQQGLRHALLGVGEAATSGDPAERFRELALDLEHSALGRDPRARHYLAKLGAALPQDPTDPEDPALRDHLLTAHEAALDLIEFLQAELGRVSLAAVDALRIEALPPLSPPDQTTSA